MRFAPYNIHVCISKGNVVYEAHVILLQLNCKNRYIENLLQNFVLLYRSFKLHLVLFSILFDAIQASRNYNIVILTLLITLTVYMI